MSEVYTDIIATPECAPWSRASGSVPPKGFKDERAQLFVKAAAIIADQRKRNPHLDVLFENIDIHPALRSNAAKQEELLQGRFTVSTANQLGGMSSRPRRIHSTMATSDQLIQCAPAGSAYALEAGWTPITHPMFCLLPTENKWNPQECIRDDALARRTWTGA